MEYCVDFKIFYTEFKNLVDKGYSFWEALELLKNKYGTKNNISGNN